MGIRNPLNWPGHHHAVLLVNWLGGPIWLGAALAGVAFVPYVIWYVARMFRPGQYLYLSPKTG